MIDGTTFVLIDYGKHGATDLAFVETAVGTTISDVLSDIRNGQHENVRGVYTVFEGRFVDMSKSIAEMLTRLPTDTLSEAAREFIDYCGLEIAEAAE